MQRPHRCGQAEADAVGTDSPKPSEAAPRAGFEISASLYAWDAGDDGLAPTVYGPSTVTPLVGAWVPVNLSRPTSYLFSEQIRVQMDAAEAVA